MHLRELQKYLEKRELSLRVYFANLEWHAEVWRGSKCFEVSNQDLEVAVEAALDEEAEEEREPK